MGKIYHVFDAMWQQFQDKQNPRQQSDVEEPRRNRTKHSISVSPLPSAIGDDDDYPNGNVKAKLRKTSQTSRREISDIEDDRKTLPNTRLIQFLPMRHSKISGKSSKKQKLLVRRFNHN